MRRITILLAAMAALMLVPAAQAFAGEMHLTIAGTGEGEVLSGYAAEPGTPNETIGGSSPIDCTYNGSSQSGPCSNNTNSIEECEGFGFASGCEALSVYAEEGSEFKEWVTTQGSEFEGPCHASGAGNRESVCIFEGAPNVATTAVFCLTGESLEECLPPSGPALTIAKTGEGTVASSPAGIECTGAKTGAECEHKFGLNEMVTLTASPASGYAFSAWAGCTEHVGLTCKVKMEKAKTVKVTFVATPSLSIEKTGSGQGKVGATGISCDENCSKATSAVKTGTAVTVKVTPAKGSEAAVFENGTGSASGCSGASCTFTISANSSVKVKFNAAPTKTLTVNLTGPAAYKGKVSGKGTVKGLTGSAISCGSGCTTETESFFASDTVTLTAVAGTGYTFAGWSGSEAGTCTGTTSPCTISTSANKTLSAKFE